MWYGLCLAYMGRLEEGLAETRRALRLDPLSPVTNVSYEAVIAFLRDWDGCIDHCSSVPEFNPDYSIVCWMLANALQMKGSHEEAIRERQQVVDAAPGSVTFLAELGSSYAAAGMRGDADRIVNQLHELRGHKCVTAYWIAHIHSGLKERDEAFRWLDAGLEERSSGLAYLRVDPRFDYLRPDPRFQDLLDRMKPASVTGW
jgi:tetratricopeptide (TPR) repeat protein